MAHEKFDAVISYTRQDGAAVAQRVLELLKEEKFKVWQDRTHMRGGEDFWRQIEAAIERTHTLIMLLTPDAFEGERRVLRDEWLTARRRGCRVLPVHEAKAIDFDSPKLPPWLRKLDCYNLGDPNHRAKLLNDLRTTPELRKIPHNVEFPTYFVPRDDEMRTILDALTGTEGGVRVALTTALLGAGGFGKTTLAKAVCFDDDVLARYTDGVLWLTVDEGTRSVPELLTALLQQLGPAPKSADADALFGEWKEALYTRQCLVVLDDVWKESDARALVVRETASAFLITTRIPRVATAAEARDCRVDEMTPAQAVSVLAAAFGELADRTRLAALAKKAGHWPVLLGLIANQLRHSLKRPGATPSQAIEQVEEDLRDLSLTAFDRRDPKRRDAAVATTMEASFRYLSAESSEAATRYRELAVFPNDVPMPLAVLEDLWNLQGAQARRLAEKFDDAGLARLDYSRGLILHDVFLEYLRKGYEAVLIELHNRLLAAWPDILKLPHDYAWRWFGWHCVEAGRGDALAAALLDFQWLAARLARTDLASLLADCRRLREHAAPQQRAVSLLQDALEKSADVLLVAPEQLAAQLFGRLRPGLGGELDTLIEQTKQALCTQPLQPRTQNLQPVGSALLRTLRGHEEAVSGALALPDGRLLSWSGDKTLRLWSADGAPLAELCGHEEAVSGALALPDGRPLSWSKDDKTLRLWSADGASLAVLRGHDRWVFGALPCPTAGCCPGRATKRCGCGRPTGRRLPSGAGMIAGSTARSPCPTAGCCPGRATKRCGCGRPMGRRLPCCAGTRAWSTARSPCPMAGCCPGRPGQRTTKRCGCGRPTGRRLPCCAGMIAGSSARSPLPDGRLLSWSDGPTPLRLWSADGAPLAVLRGHEGWVNGALALPDGRLLSWSQDKTLRLWSADGAPLAVLRGHEGEVSGALALPDGRRLLSWSHDPTLRLWSADGAPARRAARA